MNAVVKRKQAETALRLAQELADVALASRLKLVAAEFLDEAHEMDGVPEPHEIASGRSNDKSTDPQ